MESRVKVSRSYSGVGFIKSKVTTEVFKAKFWFRDHVTINQYFIEKKTPNKIPGSYMVVFFQKFNISLLDK